MAKEVILRPVMFEITSKNSLDIEKSRTYNPNHHKMNCENRLHRRIHIVNKISQNNVKNYFGMRKVVLRASLQMEV